MFLICITIGIKTMSAHIHRCIKYHGFNTGIHFVSSNLRFVSIARDFATQKLNNGINIPRNGGPPKLNPVIPSEYFGQKSCFISY